MDDSSPPQQVARMICGYWVSQAMYVAAKLGLADLLHPDPRAAGELAEATGTHPPSLYRLLRALAGVGVFAEHPGSRFALTPLGDCLRTNAPGSQRAFAVASGEESYRAYGELLHSVRTGRPGFDAAYGMPFFDYLARHDEQAELFDRAMVGVHGRERGAVLAAFDFSGIRVLADIGGGNGSVLAEVLRQYPSLRGLLFDLPGVVERAKADPDVADRCRAVGGDFFESVPGGADAYLLRHILHDWDDRRAVRILWNVHRMAGERTRLLVVEHVLPSGNEPSFGKLLDLTMLAVAGGRERTADEYDRLFAAGGFRLTRIVPTDAGVSVIEGHKA